MKSKILKSAIQISLSLLAILLLCVNCTQPRQRVEENGITTIDVIGNIPNVQTVYLSSIASGIEYCMLETDKQCLIAGKEIYSSGNYFVSIGENCYVFERETGTFVRKISRKGQGPDDYQETVGEGFNPENGQICVSGNRNLLFFNLDGTLSHKFNLFNPNVTFSFIAYEDMYVGYVPNVFGNSTLRIAFFDNRTGELIDSIPNDRTWKRTQTGWGYSTDYSFHKYDRNLYYKDIYCDTLYQIRGFSLLPRYLFETGNRSVPYTLQERGRFDIREAMAGRNPDKYEKYIVINRIRENAKFLFFTFDYRNSMYPAIYHKAEDKIQIISPVDIPSSYFRERKLPLYGIENDLDGGLTFWPRQMISDSEMMCVYSVEELLELDASKITDEKLKKLLKTLKEDDNPVVAIVTLKD